MDKIIVDEFIKQRYKNPELDDADVQVKAMEALVAKGHDPTDLLNTYIEHANWSE